GERAGAEDDLRRLLLDDRVRHRAAGTGAGDLGVHSSRELRLRLPTGGLRDERRYHSQHRRRRSHLADTGRVEGTEAESAEEEGYSRAGRHECAQSRRGPDEAILPTAEPELAMILLDYSRFTYINVVVQHPALSVSLKIGSTMGRLSSIF
ncbi:hypothetical protein PRIPAC_81967, partial [Pristionchus pacificus]